MVISGICYRNGKLTDTSENARSYAHHLKTDTAYGVFTEQLLHVRHWRSKADLTPGKFTLWQEDPGDSICQAYERLHFREH